MSPVRAVVALALALTACSPEPSGTREVVPLSGPGWVVWLDDDAAWEDDELHLPGVDLATLPVREPTGGWDVPARQGRAATVPGTVEGLWWPERGDHVGVSWWSRELAMPDSAAGRSARLRFDAVRLRAEVFLDGRLVGYDAVGGTPFTVDLGDAAVPGALQRLDVRVTDPGGNFDWIDHTAHRWGGQPIPASHGFGGVLGDVWLEVLDARRVDDVFVRNTADPRTVEVQISLSGADDWSGDVQLELGEWGGSVLHRQSVPAPSGGWAEPARVTISLPDARLWTPDQPALHEATVRLPDGDALSVRFGLRWFAPDGVGDDAVLRLNGRRVVARSAISWGFWPVTGAVPTRELAAQQVHSAKALGLNMLNHHRNVAHPWALDASDELGLLAHLEPGGYWAQGGDELARALAREKWLRMVAANRNRPSVVIHNMINEAAEPPWEGAVDDLLAARALDPSRVMTYTSAWADDDDPALSLHVRPLAQGRDAPGTEADALVTDGWHDQHEAPGPGCWRDGFYDGPERFRLFTDRRDDVVWRGEEAAIASPPRLALMGESSADDDGWDGAIYRRWRQGWEADLEAMGLAAPLGGLDAVTRSAADVAYDHHARTLERVRAADVLDGYVVNGWECEPFENHSGLVDIRREPKGDPARLAAANAPALLVVAPRKHVFQGAREMGAGVRAPAVVEVDLFVVNELDLRGRHRLALRATDDQNRELVARTWEVDLEGGDLFGQLLVEGERLQLDRAEGRVTLHANLFPAAGGDHPVAVGHEQLYLVDWVGVPVSDDGAMLGSSVVVESFLRKGKGLTLPAFDPTVPASEWVVVAGLDPEPSVPLLPRAFPGDEAWALRLPDEAWREDTAEFKPDRIFDKTAVPLPGGAGTTDAERWEQRWSGLYLAEESGLHRFHVQATLGARLRVDDALILDAWDDLGPRRLSSAPVELEAFRGTPFTLEVLQAKDAAAYRVELTSPSAAAPFRALAATLARQVAEQGTTLVVLEHTAAWARLFAELGVVDIRGEFHVGRYWMGGGYLAAPHPLLEGLPTGGALGWEWQELVRSDRRHGGLLLGDQVETQAETVVAVWSDHQPSLGSALAVLPHGKGRIVLCALPLVASLDAPPGAVALPRRLLCNLLSRP
jgi:hypothetical protein